MTIADRIKQKRLELNLSQSELAVRANYYDKTAISKIEHAGNDISMKQVKRLAKALNVSSAYLMGWEGQVIPEPQDPEYELQVRAKRLYDMYVNAPSDVQSAVELLLKSAQRKK